MSWFFFIVPILFFVLILRLIETEQRKHRDRMRLMEQALKGDVDLDPALKEELIGSISGRRRRRRHGPPQKVASQVGGGMKFLLFLGWITMFVGAGFLFASLEEKDLVIPGFICLGIGLAFVTYPFAVADLEYRRARAQQAGQATDRS